MMNIKSIKLKNFKSFANLEVNLRKFNVIIGANASGKSNFIQLFKFLNNIATDGLNNAVSMQGGAKYLRNIKIENTQDLLLEVKYNPDTHFGFRKKGEAYRFNSNDATYELVIKFMKTGENFKVFKESLIIKNDIFLDKKEKDIKRIKAFLFDDNKIDTADIKIDRNLNKIDYDFIAQEKDFPLKKDDLFPAFLKTFKLQPKTSLFERPYFFIIPRVGDFLQDISIYDFDPKIPKKGVPISGKNELESDGSNLAIVLKNIISDAKSKRLFLNLIKDILPFINNFSVQNFSDKSLLAQIKETYFNDQYIPASLVSDGTLNIVALICVLYFEKNPIIIIEEPERNIHPYLISKIVKMLKEASNKKQIIIITHNPEVLKYTDLEDILFVSRDENGFSSISRPKDNEEIKIFLENELGIEELFIKNLIRG